MKPIYQTVIFVDKENAMCMVESSKGNKYPCLINRLNKDINEGDTALVTKDHLANEWVVIDVEPKYPAPLDVVEFPRDNNNCLNVVQHCKYLEVIKGMSESERVDFDNMLLRKFIQDYGMKNTLKHRFSQLGYEVSHDMEPESQAKLEDYI